MMSFAVIDFETTGLVPEPTDGAVATDSDSQSTKRIGTPVRHSPH